MRLSRAAASIALATLAAGIASGCSVAASERGADSAYAIRLKKYLRDSTVIDSLARLVNTDSLRALYRLALLPAGVSEKQVAEVGCEEVRLTLMHGALPARTAIDGMLETVYKDRGIRGADAAFRYFAARAPTSGSVDTGACGPMPPRSAPIIAGTAVNDFPLRP